MTYSASASSIECVVSDTLLCRAAAAITRHSRRLATGSMPVEGSSNKSTWTMYAHKPVKSQLMLAFIMHVQDT